MLCWRRSSRLRSGCKRAADAGSGRGAEGRSTLLRLPQSAAVCGQRLSGTAAGAGGVLHRRALGAVSPSSRSVQPGCNRDPWLCLVLWLADLLGALRNHRTEAAAAWLALAAPRRRTKHLNLGGRVFLHDFDWQADVDGSTLTLILTAPLVVAHWINFQYYASTVDNRSFGSGNKVLHNVLGGHVGVFEGNGGDLRAGLPMQSLHDGREWRHAPLRLAAFIEAPTDAIEVVVSQHEVVRQLVDHGWIQLFQLDEQGRAKSRRRGGGWSEAKA